VACREGVERALSHRRRDADLALVLVTRPPARIAQRSRRKSDDHVAESLAPVFAMRLQAAPRGGRGRNDIEPAVCNPLAEWPSRCGRRSRGRHVHAGQLVRPQDSNLNPGFGFADPLMRRPWRAGRARRRARTLRRLAGGGSRDEGPRNHRSGSVGLVLVAQPAGASVTATTDQRGEPQGALRLV
jgi:hypothetical protein